MSIFNFQFGEFENVSPNWFDWFSLFLQITITAGSIYFAYYLGERIYKRDRKNKFEEEKLNVKSENDLFKNNLIELNKNILVQIRFLNEYITNKDFRLKLTPALQVNFLQFLNLKSLYTQGNDNIERINNLLSSLYSIEKITNSLSKELNTYISKFNVQENKFYGYRLAYYKKFFEYSNLRAVEMIIENGIKKWKYAEQDIFMNEYAKLRNETIGNADGTANRKFVDENFLKPLIDLANKYIPEDYNAIEIHDISNEAHSAYQNMENLTSIHFKAIESHLRILEDTKDEIEAYLK